MLLMDFRYAGINVLFPKQTSHDVSSETAPCLHYSGIYYSNIKDAGKLLLHWNSVWTGDLFQLSASMRRYCDMLELTDYRMDQESL